MRVKAEHWVNHNGTWYQPGQEYEVEPAKQEDLPAQEEPKAEPQPVKRGRKRKTED